MPQLSRAMQVRCLQRHPRSYRPSDLACPNETPSRADRSAHLATPETLAWVTAFGSYCPLACHFAYARVLCRGLREQLRRVAEELKHPPTLGLKETVMNSLNAVMMVRRRGHSAFLLPSRRPPTFPGLGTVLFLHASPRAHRAHR